MKRVDNALVDLTSTNLKSNQKAISEFTSLFGIGNTKLQDLLRLELGQHVTPIEPLHYLTKGKFLHLHLLITLLIFGLK